MAARWYLNIVLTLLFLAVCFFGIAVTKSNDRMRGVYQELLASQKRTAPTGAADAPATPDKPNLPVPTAKAANAEFFVPGAPFGDYLARAITSETGNLNWILTNEANVSMFNGLCNSSLAGRNLADPDRWEPLLATEWTIPEDHLTYQIKLRRGVLWQDVTDPVTGISYRNQPVTAQDFKFMLDVIQDPKVNCAPLKPYYQDMSITVINDYEFTVKWQKPYYGSLISTLSLTPLPKHFYQYDNGFDGEKFNHDHLRNRMIVGCGPYYLAQYTKGDRLIFKAFDRYFGQVLGIRPPLAQLSFELIQHPNTRFQALLGGKLDQLGLTPEQWQNRTGEPAFDTGELQKYRYLSHSYTYLGYNQKLPIFMDKRVRQALTMLIDRENLRHVVYQDQAEIVTGPFFPNSKYYDKTIKPWPYDPEQAGKLLDQAGYVRGADGIRHNGAQRLSFTILKVASHPIQDKIMPLIQQTLAAGGVELKIQTVEWSVYIQRLNERSYEACMLGWTTPLDPDPYQVWHSSEADQPESSNHIGFRNAEADRLIEQLRQEFDVTKRIELTHRFHQLLHEEQPYTFLFTTYSLLAQHRRYQNVLLFNGGPETDLLYVPQAEQRSLD